MNQKNHSSPEYAIVAENVKKSFKNLDVLKGVDLQVARGTMVALLGPNGAGKTTMVRILSTLMMPDSGNVSVGGYDVVREAARVRGVIGLTGQYAAVDEFLSGRENLEMMGRLYHLSKADSRRRSVELLEQFDLVTAADRSSKTYSGGMRRRLDLAASLIAVPPIIFLDEPTTGLDPRSRLAMWGVIKQLLRDGTTILLTTQYLEEADQLADKIAVINEGTIVASGTSGELKKDVGDDHIEFTIDKSSSMKKAVEVLHSQNITVNEQDRVISVASSGGTKELYTYLGRFEQAKISVESLSLRKPTLDDVFLKLTGKTTETTADNEGEK